MSVRPPLSVGAGRRLRARGRTLRPLALAFLGAGTLAGCNKSAAPTFSLAGTSIVWPAPPDQARIRYLGEITGEQSLGRKPDALAALRAVVEGPPPDVRFSSPSAVAVAGNRVYVADPAHPAGAAVHVLDLDARTWSSLRSTANAPFVWPIDVAVSAAGDSIAVADAKRPAVYIFDAAGRVTATIGRESLQRPAAVAWRGEDELWVLDAAAHNIGVFDALGRQKTQLGGRGGAPGQFNFPSGMCCSASQRSDSAGFAAVVADAMNFRVQLLDVTGVVRHTFGRKGDAAGDFSLPRDVAVDSDGHIYVLDSQFENVQLFEPDGRLLMALGGGGSGPGQLNLPSGITIDSQDRIWIADTYNRRIQAFQYLREDAP